MENQGIKEYVIVENGIITNVILTTKEEANSRGWIDPGENKYGIGWKYENDTITPPPYKLIEEEFWKEVRLKRNQLLQESDVYVLPDKWISMTTEEQELWSTYRQNLRDLPQNYDEPYIIEWPERPQ
jgi:hypothetical protein